MGQISPFATTIDGVEYVTKTYPAYPDGLDLIGRMLRCVSPGHVKLLVHEDDEGGLSIEALMAALDNKAVQAQIGLGIVQKAAELGDMKLLRDLTRFTEAKPLSFGEGAPAGAGSVYQHFGDHFAGRYGHMVKVCVWAARVGFGVPSVAAPSTSDA